MSVLQKLKSALPVDDDGVTTRIYECQECGEVFESAKIPERAQCMECLSANVTERD